MIGRVSSGPYWKLAPPAARFGMPIWQTLGDRMKIIQFSVNAHGTFMSKEGKMFSRRTFLIGFFVLTQIGLLNSIHNIFRNKRSGKFMKQGWVLQEGDI